MQPRFVVKLRDEYKAVKYENFRSNLLNLRNAMAALQVKADSDKNGLLHDQNLYPFSSRNSSFTYPRWEGSEAERKLKLDISLGRHKEVKPKVLQQSRDAYKVFPLEIFRKHIHQEVRAKMESSYWLKKKELKRLKKQKKIAKEKNGDNVNTNEAEKLLIKW